MQSSDSSYLPDGLRSFELPRLARDRVAAAGGMRPPRFRTKDFSTRMGSQTAQGPSHTRPSSHETMLPSPQRKKIGTLEKPVSQLNTQLMVSPVNASRQPWRTQGLTFEDIAAKVLDRVIDHKTDSLHSSTEERISSLPFIVSSMN